MRCVAVPQVMEADLGQGEPPNEIGEVVREAARLFGLSIFPAASQSVSR